MYFVFTYLFSYLSKSIKNNRTGMQMKLLKVSMYYDEKDCKNPLHTLKPNQYLLCYYAKIILKSMFSFSLLLHPDQLYCFTVRFFPVLQVHMKV